jgi:hypothetical protein
MAKLFSRLSLAVVLLIILFSTVSGVNLDDIFILQPGKTYGGCDDYFNQTTKKGTLDDWLEEINLSLATAIDMLDVRQYNQDIRIRRALKAFFEVPNRGKATAKVEERLNQIASTCQSPKPFNLDLD